MGICLIPVRPNSLRIHLGMARKEQAGMKRPKTKVIWRCYYCIAEVRVSTHWRKGNRRWRRAWGKIIEHENVFDHHPPTEALLANRRHVDG